jgi:hypothetical protein
MLYTYNLAGLVNFPFPLPPLLSDLKSSLPHLCSIIYVLYCI